MIKQLIIRNFQSHKDTTIDFDKGVNAIIGKSDSGKSAIFRALTWVIYNKPSGEAFRSHWGGDTEVTIILENGISVTRGRSDTDNWYAVYDRSLKAPTKFYRAFGQNVPDDVLRALNINDVNLQTQMDAPFLLGSGGGEVAQVLNRVVSLDAIDRTQSNLNKKSLSISRELKTAESNFREFTEELKKYTNLAEMERDINIAAMLEADIAVQSATRAALGILVHDICEGDYELQRLQEICDSLNQPLFDAEELQRAVATQGAVLFMLKGLIKDCKLRTESIERFRNIDTTEQLLKVCEVSNKEVAVLIGELKTLETIVEGYDGHIAKLDKYRNVGPVEQYLDRCTKLQAEVLEMTRHYNALDLIVGQLEKMRLVSEQGEKDLFILQKEFDELMPDECPLCGRS